MILLRPRHARLLLLPLFWLGVSAPAPAASRDMHDHLMDTNRAQLVMLHERGLLPAAEAAAIAQALECFGAEQSGLGGARSAEYLPLERRLTELAGPSATNIHLGRSRNDLGETMNRMRLRDLVLELIDAIGELRARLHQISGEHLETVMPGFTQSVQAQPTTVAHFLLAFDAGLQRDQERLREAYARINLSPLGVAAFTTSGFEFDRELLARLLGFGGSVENGYDAIMVSAADSKIEFSQTLGLSAIGVGRFATYLLFQYAAPSPDFLLQAEAASHSSAMPQKRNPSSIERLRLRASEVVANAHASAIFAHNTPLYEVKDVREDHMDRLETHAATAARLFAETGATLDALVIRPQALRDAIDADYSTMTELAETLHREAGVPFRVGYGVASAVATFGREQGRVPTQLSHEEVGRIYLEVIGQPLPISPEQLARSFDPLAVVKSRRGRGGPQPAETARMLAEQRASAESLRTWTSSERRRLTAAHDDLVTRTRLLAAQTR